MPKAFGGTRKAAPATDTRFAYGHRSARQMRQPTVSAAKTKQRYKKRSNCKHKKSGCVCFIVARLRASALQNRDIGDNKALCAPTDPKAKLRIYARTRKSHCNKTEIFFSIKLSSGQNAGERNKTARPSQQTRELFSIFSPTPFVAASSNSFAPHCGSHSRPRACTRIQPFFDYCLHRSPPTPIPIRM